MNELSITPVVVSSQLAKPTERKLDIVAHAGFSAKAALCAVKGSVGKAAREGVANMGAVDIIMQAASGNYRPIAEYIAARTGEAVVISNRAAFEALPDVMHGRVLNAKTAKNGGMREDKKTGAMVPGAKLALALELHAFAVNAVRGAAEIHARKAAERAERDAAEQRQLANEQQ